VPDAEFWFAEIESLTMDLMATDYEPAIIRHRLVTLLEGVSGLISGSHSSSFLAVPVLPIPHSSLLSVLGRPL